MKRIISILVLAVMVAALCVPVSADAGHMYVQCQFKDMADFMEYFHAGAFFIQEGGTLYGYSEAKALLSKYEGNDDWGGFNENDKSVWLRYDCEITLSLAPDGDGARSVELDYVDNNGKYMGFQENGNYIGFVYDVENEELSLRCRPGMGVGADDLVFATRKMTLEADSGNKFYRFGMSVDENRIRCFLDDELIFDVTDPSYCWGQYDGSCFMLWNESNLIQVRDYKVSTPGFIYPYASNPTPVESSSVASQEPVTSVVSSVSEVVVTDNNGAAVTNEKGENVTETVIVTEVVTVAPADTQGNATNGGTATTTGDATFFVIAAAIVALGSAITVLKVRSR